MIEFIFGFVCGIASIVILFPLFSKLLMKIFIKKKMNMLTDSIAGNLIGLGNKFENMQNGEQEINKTISEGNGGENIGSEGTSDDPTERDNRRRKGNKV